jgi:putative tricarboxylic transport membrane protein
VRLRLPAVRAPRAPHGGTFASHRVDGIPMILRKTTGVIAATGIVAAGALFLLWNTRSFAPSLLPGYPGDAFFPRIILAFVLLCAAAVIGYTLASRRGARTAGATADVAIDVRSLALVAAFVGGYAVLLMKIGFEIATFLFLCGLLGRRIEGGGVRAWAMAAGIAAVSVAVLYGCFVLLLGVDMPLLFLPKYLD